MQILRSSLVRVRGARWRVAHVHPYGECELLTLVGLTPPDVGRVRRVLAPFDVLDPIERPARPRIVTARRWRRACRALAAADTPPGSLRAARAARFDVMPHQLAPALAVVRGRGTRLLLADAVGLGKTIEAGLVLAELLERGWIERTLVLTPAGLRDQWLAELAQRFGIEAVSTDAAFLRRRVAAIPVGLNPWFTAAAAVASVDYVKRADVLPAVAACRWDAIVIDEAHGCVADSDRHRAIETLASRAPFVILLTATPHNGDRRAFASLCAIGAADDSPLLVFRRTRADVGLPDRRRVRALRVRQSDGERRMHERLAAYADAIRAERPAAAVALSVLHKRAFSSAWSLWQSVERRLAALAETADGRQLELPLGDPDGELTAVDEPPPWPADLSLADRGREHRLLTAVAAAAAAAARRETKLTALARLLRRARESAVVFTEYRDTLLRVQRDLRGLDVVVLHGGMARDERTAALAAFRRGGRTILLATDAAGEGLNLHATCRLVVNLELPWNPMRLEQRIGRVDRIGQPRTVHAVHLVADGTGEADILARLESRLAIAAAEIGAPDPLSSERKEPGREGPDGRTPREQPADGPLDEQAEARRLHLARALARAGDEPAAAAREAGGPWLLPCRRARLKAALGSRTLLLFRVACEDAWGRVAESSLVPIVVATGPSERLDDLIAAASRRVEHATAGWHADAARAIETAAATRLARERAIAAHARAGRGGDRQPGLFDRRAERTWETDERAAADAGADVARRIAGVESALAVTSRPPELLLAVVPHRSKGSRRP